MDDKRRSKRKSMDDGFWDCSVCTYRNTPEAFKCEMCDVRKGTSTRKPRLNPQLVAQQVVAQQIPVPAPPKKEKGPRFRENRDNERDIEMRDVSDPFDDIDSPVSPPSSTEVSPKVEVKVKPQKEERPNKVVSPVSAVTVKESPKEPREPPIVKDHKDVKEPVPAPQVVKEPKPKHEKSTPASTSTTPRSRRPTKLTQLKNIDRSTGRSMEVTVGDVTVIITDYKPKKEKEKVDKNSSITTDQESNPGVAITGASPANSNNHVQSNNSINAANS